jgi:hypothetical protein
MVADPECCCLLPEPVAVQKGADGLFYSSLLRPVSRIRNRGATGRMLQEASILLQLLLTLSALLLLARMAVPLL